MQQGYPRFFYLDGTPLKLASRDEVPQRFVAQGQWEPFRDLERFANAALPMDEGSFDLLLEGFASSTRPAAVNSGVGSSSR